MKIAFYRGSGKPFDILVKWWTSGNYSHCELVVNYPLSASSSFLDGGVRFKEIDYQKHPDRWDFVDISFLPTDTLNNANAWFLDNTGTKYDALGLLGFLFRFYKGSGRKKFCSEAIGTALGFSESWRLDPNTLYAVLESMRKQFATK